MRPANDLFADFAAAVLDATVPTPAELSSWNGSEPAVRFAVYRNNVVTALTEALAETFPVTRALVGDAFFFAMARAFLVFRRPRTPLLLDHAQLFPAFVGDFEPAQSLPYLEAMAHLELARVQAFRAADAEPLSHEELERFLEMPERLPAVCLDLHPSLTIVEASHAIVSLWAAHQGHGHVEDVVLARPEAALVLRPANEVIVVPVVQTVALGIRRLVAGARLGDLPAADAEDAGSAMLTELLTLLIRHDAIVAWHHPGDP